jgi:hypothetical protein
MAKKNLSQPANPLHPGEILLEEFLQPGKITSIPSLTIQYAAAGIARVARRSGVTMRWRTGSDISGTAPPSFSHLNISDLRRSMILPGLRE